MWTDTVQLYLQLRCCRRTDSLWTSFEYNAVAGNHNRSLLQYPMLVYCTYPVSLNTMYQKLFQQLIHAIICLCLCVAMFLWQPSRTLQCDSVVRTNRSGAEVCAGVWVVALTVRQRWPHDPDPLLGWRIVLYLKQSLVTARAWLRHGDSIAPYFSSKKSVTLLI